MTEHGAVTAYDHIRRRIVEGRLRSGERLVEQAIAEELDISRPPVREAWRMLQLDALHEDLPPEGGPESAG